MMFRHFLANRAARRKLRHNPVARLSDCELAGLVRRTMALFGEDDGDRGVRRVAAASGALFLIGAAIEADATSSEVRCGGVTIRGDSVGEAAD